MVAQDIAMVSDNSLPPAAIADQPRQQPAKGAPLDADVLLQASRRVDWRFLLPDPNLGRVAYFGPARGALLESLRLFSAALALGEAASSGGAQHDLVVIH